MILFPNDKHNLREACTDLWSLDLPNEHKSPLVIICKHVFLLCEAHEVRFYINELNGQVRNVIFQERFFNVFYISRSW